MVSLMLDDDVAEQLKSISEQQNRPVSEVIRQLLAEHREVQPAGNPNWLRKMAEMAEQDRDIVWKDEPDLSERSREILERESI
jgi:predicted transcriptional regulator